MIVRTNVKEIVASDPADGRGRSVRLVPFLFGLAATLDRAELPGRVLVAMLADLGLTAAAARALIARMQRDGQLAGVRRGRGVEYRLVGAFAESFHRIRTAAPGPPWPGYFQAVLYQVPERHRAYRDELRRAGQLVGYGLLQQGLLISPTDRLDRLRPVLAKAPREAQVQVAQLHMATTDAARAASVAWDLSGLDRTYRTHARTLRAAARRATPPPPDGQTLHRVAELLSGPLVDTLRATGLPAELTPPDWSLPQLWAAIEEVQQVYVPPAAAHLRRLLES
jgi:phenylacetic acid degradation operon negative regulatory protein